MGSIVNNTRRTTLVLIGIAVLVKMAFLISVQHHPMVVFPISDSAHFIETARGIQSSGLIQDDAFYFAPFYPYLLAGVFTLFGENLFLVAICQTLWGAFNAVVVFHLGKTAFNSTRTGMIAAVLTLLYGPFYLYDVILWKSTLALLLFNLSLLLLLKGIERPDAARFGSAGLLLGVVTLLRGNTLVVIPFIFFGLLWLARSRTIGKINMAAWCVGVFLAVSPATLHNAIAAHDFVPTTYQGGTNFYIGNHEGANGTYVPLTSRNQVPGLEKRDAVSLAEAAAGTPLKPSQVSRYWLRKGFDYIVQNPVAWASLMIKKAVLLHCHVEIADTIDFGAFRATAPQLWMAFLPFSVIMGLAAAGVLFSWTARRDLIMIFAVTIGVISSILPFFVLSRLRFPLVSMYILFAAVALAKLASLVKEGQWRRAASVLLIVAPLCVYSHLMSPAPRPGVTYNSLGNIYLNQMMDFESAERYFRRAIDAMPQETVYRGNLARALEMQGNITEAARVQEELIRLLRKKAANGNAAEAAAQIAIVERGLAGLTERSAPNRK